MTAPSLGARWVAACKAAGVEPWAAGMLVTRAAAGDIHARCKRLSWMHAGEYAEHDTALGRSDAPYRRYMGIDYVGAFPSWGWPSPGSGWAPDLTDPATVGAAVGILRAWSGDPGAHVSPSGGRWVARVGTPHRWLAEVAAPTEAEALVAAAEALAAGGAK